MELAETGINTSDRSDSMTTFQSCHSIFSKKLFFRNATVTARYLSTGRFEKNSARLTGKLLRDEDAGHNQRCGTPKKEAG